MMEPKVELGSCFGLIADPCRCGYKKKKEKKKKKEF